MIRIAAVTIPHASAVNPTVEGSVGDVVENTPQRSLVTRRNALRLAGLGAAGVAVGSTSLEANAHGTLYWHDEIWDAPTLWDGTGVRRGDYYNATFYNQLESWLSLFYGGTPLNWVRPIYIRYAGVHADKSGSCAGMSGSCHSYGRAFDIRHIIVTNSSTGSQMNVFNARYDQWAPGSSTTLKRYWATVASFNYYFTYVIHYLYAADTSHRNHVHVDNSVNGSGGTFSTGRSTQVHSTQACLRYIWGYSTTIDGIWGPQTDSHSRAALSRIGLSGGLTSSSYNWQQFNYASLRFGTGRQTY